MKPTVISLLLFSLLLQASIIRAEERSATEIASDFIDLLSAIQHELKLVKKIEEKEQCGENIRQLVHRLKTPGEQYSFAWVAYRFLSLDSEANDYPSSGYGYETAFTECLRLMAKDKSKETAECFKFMRSKLDLDGGLAFDFNRAASMQADPSYK